jgi:hypothetical protein
MRRKRHEAAVSKGFNSAALLFSQSPNYTAQNCIKLRRYRKLGLTFAECGKLLGIGETTARVFYRKIRESVPDGLSEAENG